MPKKQKFKPHDHPYDECIRGAERMVASGGSVFQKWWCAGCGDRCRANRPNYWTPLCVCESCGTITDVKKQGCNYAALVPGGGVSEFCWYILDADHNVVKVNDLLTWARWMEDEPNARIVAWTGITSDPDIHVSTVFIGLDHRHFGKGPPIVFETMIFGGELDGSQWRYSSYDDAEIGHKLAVRRAREAAGQKVKT